jgi:hypothetical protein
MPPMQEVGPQVGRRSGEDSAKVRLKMRFPSTTASVAMVVSVANVQTMTIRPV